MVAFKYLQIWIINKKPPLWRIKAERLVLGARGPLLMDPCSPQRSEVSEGGGAL